MEPKTSFQRRQLDAIAARVRSLGLTEHQLVSRVAGLTGQSARLFAYLAEQRAPVDTIAVRNKCSIGNVSAAAAEVNKRLEEAGDARRVRCTLKPHVNQFGETNSLGAWALVDEAQLRDCA